MSLAPSSELAHMTALDQLAPEFTSEVLCSTGFFVVVVAIGIKMRSVCCGILA